jgi:hypothetical protein
VGLKGLRQGPAYLVENKGGGGRKWTPRISWKDGETKTIAFLTPADEIAKIKVHEFAKVPDPDAKDGFRWANLMCRKDPAWIEESGNKCAACDILGHKAKERQVAVAVELESVGGAKSKQFKVRTISRDRDDGTKVEYPQYGLVSQGYKISMHILQHLLNVKVMLLGLYSMLLVRVTMNQQIILCFLFIMQKLTLVISSSRLCLN